MADVVIGGNAAGAVAAVAEAQAAIDSLTGKTVMVDVVTRGLGNAVGDMGKFNDSAKNAAGSARDMGDHMGRAADHVGRSADHMGRMAGHARDASDHIGRGADDAGRMATHMAAVDNIMRGGAAGAVQHAAAMRQLAGDTDSASQSLRSLGAGAADVQKAIGGSDAGAGFRDMGAAARGTTAEVMGIYRTTRQAITAAGEAGQAFNTASGHTSQMGTDLARMGSQAGGAGNELAKASRGAMEMAKGADGAYRTIDALGKSMGGGGGAGGGILSGWGDIGGSLSGIAGMASSAARPLMMVGLAAGVSAIGMGALGAAVAGVGLAGVAEDFAHNNQLMNAGKDAVHGFNKEFSQMRSETSASGMPQMDALKASAAGVGHELAKIGADNMGSTLGHANELAGSLTQTMKQLAPAIGPSEQALTSLAGAALAALGNSAPEIARFANVVTQNAGGLQSATEGIIRGASALGGGLVQGLSAAAPAINGIATGLAGGVDAVSGAFGIQSNFSGKPGPDGTPEGAVDTGIPDGRGGTVKTAGSSGLDRFASGATRGGIAGAALGSAIGSVVPGIGTGIGLAAGGLIGGAVGGFAGLSGNVANLPGTQEQGTPTLGKPMTQRDMFGPSRAGAGNFGYSGGPALPPGTSPTAAQDAMNSGLASAGLPPPGQPHYSGVGPRGPGSSVGAMPASAAVALGGGSIQPFNDMMSAAGKGAASAAPMQSAGQAAVKHFTKAVESGGGEAASAGAGMGAALGGGVGTGMTKTETVNDTIIRKHIKHIVDAGAAEGEIHSPSELTRRRLGQPLGQGTALGVQDTFATNKDAAGGLLGHYGNESKAAPVISMRRKGSTKANYGDPAAAEQAAAPAAGQVQGKPAMSYSSEIMDRIAGHNQGAFDRGVLREQRHETALNLVDPARNLKMSSDVNPLAGTPGDPMAGPGASWWDKLNSRGPQDDMKKLFSAAGQNSAQGATDGINAGIPKVQAAGANVAGAGAFGYAKRDDQASPSRVWASLTGNSVAGAVNGLNAGIPALATAGAGMAASMAAAARGPMSDSALQVGYTWTENVVTGAVSAMKKANTSALGEPSNLSPLGMSLLATTGLLRAGSGASTWKSNSGAPASVSFGGAPSTIAVTLAATPVQLDGQHVATIAERVVTMAFDQATGTYQAL